MLILSPNCEVRSATMTGLRHACVDWAALISDLQYQLGDPEAANPNLRTPIGTQALSKRLKVSRGTVRNILDGTKVEWHMGQELIALWCQLTGKPAAFLPTTSKNLSAAGLKTP